MTRHKIRRPLSADPADAEAGHGERPTQRLTGGEVVRGFLAAATAHHYTRGHTPESLAAMAEWLPDRGDPLALEALADWLFDRGDPREELVRAELGRPGLGTGRRMREDDSRLSFGTAAEFRRLACGDGAGWVELVGYPAAVGHHLFADDPDVPPPPTVPALAAVTWWCEPGLYSWNRSAFRKAFDSPAAADEFLVRLGDVVGLSLMTE